MRYGIALIMLLASNIIRAVYSDSVAAERRDRGITIAAGIALVLAICALALIVL